MPWQERTYDAFWTQTPVDMAGFSDDPISVVPEDDQFFGFFAAKHVARYLENYTKTHVYNGESLHSRIVFGANVTSLRKTDGKWTAVTGAAGVEYHSPRVVDATGLTSSPNIPSIPGLADFKGQVLHHKQFGRSDILTDPKVQSVVVVGGAKSAADVAYASAKAGKKKVTWIIRRSGSGPAAFFGVQGPPGYRNSNESFYTRFIGYLLASVFARYPWWIRWLYSTNFGTRLLQKFWASVTAGTFAAADYEREDGKANGYYNLKPDTPIFWQNDSSSVNNRVDLLDVIAQKVCVIREDITKLSDATVHLDGGKTVDSVDAIVYATGWDNKHPYLEAHQAAELGLPFKPKELHETMHGDPKAKQNIELKKWEAIEAQASARTLSQFRILRNPPTHHVTSDADSTTPYRLFRALCPVEDTSIVFPGHVMVGNHFRVSEAQALWLVALWDGKVKVSSKPEESIGRTVAWNRLRYLDKGRSGNWFYFDVVPYTDLLLDEIGVGGHRQGLFRPIWAGDLKNCVDEYRVIREGGRKARGGGGFGETVEGVKGLYQWVKALL